MLYQVCSNLRRKGKNGGNILKNCNLWKVPIYVESSMPMSITWRRSLSTITSNNTVDHENLIQKANERYAELKKEHHRLKTENIPENSFAPSEKVTGIDADLIRRKRLLYRSKQRGWLEVDLLLGSWAAENVFSLTEEEMNQYEDLLNQETIDIFNLINKKIDPLPPHLDTKIMKRLQDYAYGKPFGSSSEDNLIETYTKKKEETKLI